MARTAPDLKLIMGSARQQAAAALANTKARAKAESSAPPQKEQ